MWAASERYFGVPPRKLDTAEASLLAGLIQAPSRYDPVRSPLLARARQADVLRSLVRSGYLSEAEAAVALGRPLRLRSGAILAPIRGVDLAPGPAFIWWRLALGLGMAALGMLLLVAARLPRLRIAHGLFALRVASVCSPCLVSASRSGRSGPPEQPRSPQGAARYGASAGTTLVVSVLAVLIVDDDPPIRRMLERTFVAEGYAVASAADGGEALAAVERSVPDLVVLDVTMPGVDGLAVCRRLRRAGLATPILFLTARDAVADRVAGLDAGADDYLVKPFAIEELLARARALVRRRSEAGDVLAFDDLVFDVRARVARRGDSKLVDLSAREAALLELLLRNPRQVISRAQALEQIWGSASGASYNVVDRYVSYLRRKLGEPQLIHTVRGIGFVLDR